MGKLHLLLILWFLVCPATAATPPPDACSTTIAEIDCRADFEAGAYSGIAIDSFAASELNNYINPGVSAALKERAIAGFDFQYRLLGDRTNPGKLQLWIYGKTQHGVRSADVDCSAAANSTVPVCGSFLQSNLSSVQPSTRFIYMLRSATSLEAFTGLRLEFPALQRTGGNAARPYLNAQFGFLTVAGSGAGAVGIEHLGLGLVATTGRFLESHLEVGFGRNGLFLRQPNSRLIVDAYLEWDSKIFSVIKARPFVQLTVDSDHGPGADSIETYLGLKFDLDKIFLPMWRTLQCSVS
jgi:hypothetical protein